MPPRHAYWTIILEGKPTAFRAREQEELLPTLRQLQSKHPDAVLKWFARGRLWHSQEEERMAAALKRSRTGERRPPTWRPGGTHEDPRERFKVPRDEKRRRFAAKLRRDRRDDERPAGEGGSRPPPREPRPGGEGGRPPRPGQRPGGQGSRPPRPGQRPGGEGGRPPRSEFQRRGPHGGGAGRPGGPRGRGGPGGGPRGGGGSRGGGPRSGGRGGGGGRGTGGGGGRGR